jgi:hypothetical protein
VVRKTTEVKKEEDGVERTAKPGWCRVNYEPRIVDIYETVQHK